MMDQPRKEGGGCYQKSKRNTGQAIYQWGEMTSITHDVSMSVSLPLPTVHVEESRHCRDVCPLSYPPSSHEIMDPDVRHRSSEDESKGEG